MSVECMWERRTKRRTAKDLTLKEVQTDHHRPNTAVVHQGSSRANLNVDHANITTTQVLGSHGIPPYSSGGNATCIPNTMVNTKVYNSVSYAPTHPQCNYLDHSDDEYFSSSSLHFQ